MNRASPIDDDLLSQLVSGSLPVAETFSIAAKPLLTRDLHDEVGSQCLEFLIEAGSTFECGRGTAKSFLNIIASRAARRVRAHYCRPGSRTRLGQRQLLQRAQAAISLPLDLNRGFGTSEAARAREAI
jgi:hypothetical protein